MVRDVTDEQRTDSDSFKSMKSEASSGEICSLMQEIGLPGLRLVPGTFEVAAFNDLFADLVASVEVRDHRRWFIEGVLPLMTKSQKANWTAAVANSEPVDAHLDFTRLDGSKTEFQMRSVRSMWNDADGRSILCVFVPCSGASFETEYNLGFAEGQEMERSRIRNELHRNVSQKLLGVAFGCKLLAEKIEKVNEDLSKEASDLAKLLNGSVVDLQNLTRREQD
jgi:signal transduction histidine kinase